MNGDTPAFAAWLPTVSFVVLSVLFALGEAVLPLRPVRQLRGGLLLDAVGVAIAALVSALAAGVTLAVLRPYAPRALPFPLAHPVARGAMFFLLTDMSRYITHRWMHRPSMWRFHAFHHSPEQIYWLSGNRVTPVHVVLFTVPTALCTWALSPPPAVLAANIVLMVLWNHFMHTNLRLSPRLQRALEGVVTTPRYHHIHHARDPRLLGLNLGALLTCWDRLFGTYKNPDLVAAAELEFGIDRPKTPGASAKMVLGL